MLVRETRKPTVQLDKTIKVLEALGLGLYTGIAGNIDHGNAEIQAGIRRRMQQLAK